MQGYIVYMNEVRPQGELVFYPKGLNLLFINREMYV